MFCKKYFYQIIYVLLLIIINNSSEFPQNTTTSIIRFHEKHGPKWHLQFEDDDDGRRKLTARFAFHDFNLRLAKDMADIPLLDRLELFPALLEPINFTEDLRERIFNFSDENMKGICFLSKLHSIDIPVFKKPEITLECLRGMSDLSSIKLWSASHHRLYQGFDKSNSIYRSESEFSRISEKCIESIESIPSLHNLDLIDCIVDESAIMRLNRISVSKNIRIRVYFSVRPSDFNFFEYCKKIKNLDTVALPSSSFQDLIGISTLSEVKRIEITVVGRGSLSLPEEFARLTTLEDLAIRLYLEGRRYNDVNPKVNDIFQGLHKLKRVEVEDRWGNPLQPTILNFLRRIPNLETLHIRTESIMDQMIRDIQSLSKLKVLWLEPRDSADFTLNVNNNDTDKLLNLNQLDSIVIKKSNITIACRNMLLKSKSGVKFRFIDRPSLNDSNND